MGDETRSEPPAETSKTDTEVEKEMVEVESSRTVEYGGDEVPEAEAEKKDEDEEETTPEDEEEKE